MDMALGFYLFSEFIHKLDCVSLILSVLMQVMYCICLVNLRSVNMCSLVWCTVLECFSPSVRWSCKCFELFKCCQCNLCSMCLSKTLYFSTVGVTYKFIFILIFMCCNFLSIMAFSIWSIVMAGTSGASISLVVSLRVLICFRVPSALYILISNAGRHTSSDKHFSQQEVICISICS